MSTMKKFFSFGKNRKESSDSSHSKRGSVVSRSGSVVSLSSVTQSAAGGYEVREKDLGKLHKAVLQGDLSKIQTLVRKETISGFDKQKRTALHFACAVGNAEAVKELLAWKANVNLGDNEAKTPLIKTVECNHPACTALLLNAKADPKTKDKEGNTALHYAARFGYHDVMTLLLDAVDKGRRDPGSFSVKNNNGFSPLHLAVFHHQNIICSDLLEHDADINFPDKTGNTPLMIACELGHTDLVDMLLQYEADTDIKNMEGWTAEDIAQRKGQVQCSKLIVEYASQPPGSTSRMAAEAADDDDEEGDDDDDENIDDKGASAKKDQQAVKGEPVADTDSWQDSDSEQPTVHSRQLQNDLSQKSPQKNADAVNNLAYTVGDISAELDEPHTMESVSEVPLNNLSQANARHHDISYSTDPGYEAIKIAGSSQKPNVNSSDVGQKKSNQAASFLATSLEASGDYGKSTNQAELQVPHSARSTLSGRSWLSDSKWSDDEDENDESVGGPSLVRPGAISKTSASASANTSLKNKNNGTTNTMKNTNLTAGTTSTALVAESNKNGNNNMPNDVSSKKKVDKNQLRVDDMGLEDIDSANDNGASKPPNSARSTVSEWDSSLSEIAGAGGMIPNNGLHIAASASSKPMAHINEKSESDSKWDSDEDIPDIPTIPSFAPPPVATAAVVNKKEPTYTYVEKKSFPSKPPPVPPPPVPRYNLSETDEAELAESSQVAAVIDTVVEELHVSVTQDVDSHREQNPIAVDNLNETGSVASCEDYGLSVAVDELQGKELHQNVEIKRSETQRVRRSFVHEEFGYFTKTVVEDDDALGDEKVPAHEGEKGSSASDSNLSEIAEDDELQALSSQSDKIIVTAFGLQVQVESRGKLESKQEKLNTDLKSIDEAVPTERAEEVSDTVIVVSTNVFESASNSDFEESMPNHDYNGITMLKRVTNDLSPDVVVSQQRDVTQEALSKDGNVITECDFDDDDDEDPEQAEFARGQPSRLSDFDLSYRLNDDGELLKMTSKSKWTDSTQVSHVNVFSRIGDASSRTESVAAAGAASKDEQNESCKTAHSVGTFSSASGSVVIDRRSSVLTSIKSSSVQISAVESHLDISNVISHSSMSVSQQDSSEQVVQDAISDVRIDAYHKIAEEDSVRDQISDKNECTQANSVTNEVLKNRMASRSVKSDSDEEEESTWETERKAAKVLSKSENSNADAGKAKAEQTKPSSSDRNPSPAPSTSSLHGGKVSLDTDISNVMRLQDQLREMQKKLDDTRNQQLSFEHKCKALDEDRSQLQQKLDNLSRERMDLEQTKIDLEAKLRNMEYQLSEAQRRKENAELLCEKMKDQSTRKEEQIKNLMDTNQKLKVQLDESHTGHVKEVDELKAFSSTGHEPELYAVQLQLERAKELHKDEINRLQFEIDELKKENSDLQFKLNCGEDALTHSKLDSSMELNAVKIEAHRLLTGFTKEKEDRDKLDAMVSSLKIQLSSLEAELRTEQNGKKELERQMQYQTDQWRRSLEQSEDELKRSQSTVQNQTVQLADLLGKVTELESKLQITSANLTERMSQLTSVQKNLDEKRTSYETLDDNWRKEKETNIRLSAKVEALEEKLHDAVQEVQRLKLSSDHDKGSSADKLASLLNEMRDERDKTKLEMQQKNAALTETVNRTKEELRSVERDKASMEDEKRRMQTQLTNLQRQLATTEASVETGNQQRQQLTAETQQLNRQVDSLKEKLEQEQRRASSAEFRLSELADKLKNSEKMATTASERLNQESSSLLSISKSKREMEESLHRMELEKTKLEVSLEAERQKVALLQRDYNDAKLAQKAAMDDFSKIKASNAQLQCLMNEAAGLRQQATQDADDNRALWESEIKSRSKLGLRIAQLEREKQEVLNHLNEEKRKARKAMEVKRTLETKLSQEEHRASQMEKEIVALRTHLKTAKKRLKAVEVQMTLDRVSHELDDARQRIQQDIGETGNLMYAGGPDQMLYSMPIGVVDGHHRQSGVDTHQMQFSMPNGAIDGRRQTAGHDGHLLSDGLKSYQTVQMNLAGNYMERPDLQRLKTELEAKAQRELDEKLEEVNTYLVEQTKARERLDRIRDNNEMEIRKEFDRMKKDLLEEVVRLKAGVHRDNVAHDKDVINRQTKESELQMRELFESEQRLRQRLTARLDQAMDKASKTPTFFGLQYQSDGDGTLAESIRMQLDQSILRHLDTSTSAARSVSSPNGFAVDGLTPLQRNDLA